MKKKSIYLLSVLTIFLMLIIGFTFAYYVISRNVNFSATTKGLDYYIRYTKGNTLTGELKPSSTYNQGGLFSEITFYKIDDTYDIYGSMYLDVSEISPALKESTALKYTIESDGTIVSSGSLKGITVGNKNYILKNLPLEIRNDSEPKKFKVYIWLDESENIDASVSGSTFKGEVICTSSMKIEN